MSQRSLLRTQHRPLQAQRVLARQSNGRRGLVGGRRDWSTIAAGVSLVVAWQARRIQGRAADFSNCLEAARELRDAMRRVHDAPDAAKVKFEFTELLNLLEALALLYNDGKIAASTKKFTGNFLDEVLAWIRADASMKQRMQETETSPTTYQELKLFEKNRPQESRQLTKAYAKKRGLR